MHKLTQDQTSLDSENFALPLPISSGALAIANHFATQCAAGEKAEQVRLNTLAVCVVRDYLAMMGVETDIAAGDGWNAVTRLMSDTADLVITEQGARLGRVECRPMVVMSDGGQIPTACPVPPEVWDDRLGYLVVQLDVANQEAVLLGFTPTAAVEALPLSQLQAPEDLLDHLETLKATPASTRSGWTQLSEWWSAVTTEVGVAVEAAVEAVVEGAIGPSWVAVESLLNPAQPQLAFRYRRTEVPQASQVRRAKRIQLGSYTLVLVLSQSLNPSLDPSASDPSASDPSASDPSSTPTAAIDLLIQVYPIANLNTLPLGLQLRILESSGEEFARVEARPIDEVIQYAFNGEPGERFQIQLCLPINGQEESVIEGFQI